MLRLGTWPNFAITQLLLGTWDAKQLGEWMYSTPKKLLQVRQAVAHTTKCNINGSSLLSNNKNLCFYHKYLLLRSHS